MNYVKNIKITRFSENEEIRKIALWDMKTNIGDIDELDLKIVELILNRKKLSNLLLDKLF